MQEADLHLTISHRHRKAINEKLQELFAERVLRLGKPTTLVLTNGGALAIDELAVDPDALAGGSRTNERRTNN